MFVLASLVEKFKVLIVIGWCGDEELCWTDRQQFGKLVRQLLLQLASQVGLLAFPLVCL